MISRAAHFLQNNKFIAGKAPCGADIFISSRYGGPVQFTTSLQTVPVCAALKVQAGNVFDGAFMCGSPFGVANVAYSCSG